MSSPAAAAEDFADRVDVGPLRTLAVQQSQTLKTLDTFSRQVLSTITGRGAIDGREPVFTVFDMAYRPASYVERKIIKVRHVPLREDLASVDGLSADEKKQIVHDGLISLAFWGRRDVQATMEEQFAGAVHKAEAIQALAGQASSLQALLGSRNLVLPPAAFFPPAPERAGGAQGGVWLRADQASADLPTYAGFVASAGKAPADGGDYPADAMNAVDAAAVRLLTAWDAQDAPAANAAIADLAAALPAVNPAVYPSPLKRSAEVAYNRAARLTIPGAAVYFAAFVLFLMAGRSGWGGLRIWGLRFMAVGLVVHTAAIGVRWWLVQGSTGDWFHAIPIKNQFESVLFSAWFAAAVGLALELRGRVGAGFFGAAASFVGWLSLVAIFSAPYVFGRDIGGEIGQAAGVLMSYWLYIHVTMVVASYALIGMGFLLSVWWLAAYHFGGSSGGSGGDRDGGSTVTRTLPRPADESDYEVGPGGAAVVRGFGPTLARLFFLPAPAGVGGGSAGGAATVSPLRDRAVGRSVGDGFLQRLDACNLVVLQLAFWVLGIGIIFGAVWADMSWGRPWGWDPKETFALVTWIVYLAVVHVRVATALPIDKAWWTAVLSVVGFGVMLFNWIGVNFFLVGLHSYA